MEPSNPFNVALYAAKYPPSLGYGVATNGE